MLVPHKTTRPKKQTAIHFLGARLTSQGCRVFHDQADADLFIVQKAIEPADTDLLILLLHHVPPHSKKTGHFNVQTHTEDLVNLEITGASIMGEQMKVEGGYLEYKLIKE